MSPGRPERGRKDRPVILSEAKDLPAPRARPFAARRGDHRGTSQTLGSSPVILSEAKDLPAPRARPFASLRACPRAQRRGDMVRSLRLMPITADLSAHGKPTTYPGYFVKTHYRPWFSSTNFPNAPLTTDDLYRRLSARVSMTGVAYR